MSLITYEDKIKINENPEIPEVNKCQASDMNEIKNVVNQNYNELKKHSITSYLSSNITFPSGTLNYLKIDLTDSINTGDKLQIGSVTVDGTTYKGIIVGKNVSKINLSSLANFINNNNTSSMYFVFYILRMRDGTASNVARVSSSDIPAEGRTVGMPIPSFNFEVQEGDLFYLRMYKSMSNGNCDIIGSSTEMRTFLTAEVIE